MNKKITHNLPFPLSLYLAHKNTNMKKWFQLFFGLFFTISLVSFLPANNANTITVNVTQLRNSVGVVQFSLYNKDESIPDEHFEKYFIQLKSKITNQTAQVTFKNLPQGNYAINILHDENEDGIVDKGIILPVEGLGFSNFTALNLFNRPSYKRARFELKGDTTIIISTIYM